MNNKRKKNRRKKKEGRKAKKHRIHFSAAMTVILP
jgi:hypothetical protein